MDDLIFSTTEQNGSGEPEEGEQEVMTIDKVDLPIHRPKQSLVLRVAMADGAGQVEQAAALVALVNGCLDPEGREYVRKRLEDPDDKLDIEFVIGPVANRLLTKYSGRPTTPPSGSSRRRRPTKKASSAASPSKG